MVPGSLFSHVCVAAPVSLKPNDLIMSPMFTKPNIGPNCWNCSSAWPSPKRHAAYPATPEAGVNFMVISYGVMSVTLYSILQSPTSSFFGVLKSTFSAPHAVPYWS